MGYPIARGPRDITGDTLLIKCIEYVPPKTGLEMQVQEHMQVQTDHLRE